MNVYDFDKTIYRGDSTVDFWRHCLRRYPGAARALPGTLAKALAFRQGNCSREQFKERFYQFLRFVPEAAQEAEPEAKRKPSKKAAAKKPGKAAAAGKASEKPEAELLPESPGKDGAL